MRIIFWILILILLLLAGWWIDINVSDISFSMWSKDIAINPAIGFFALVFIYIVFALTIQFLQLIISIPANIRAIFSPKEGDNIKHLERAIVDLYNNNTSAFTKSIKRCRNVGVSSNIVTLLSANQLKLQGKLEEALSMYIHLAEAEETSSAGLREIIGIKFSEDQYENALYYAKQLWDQNKDLSSLSLLLKTHIGCEDILSAIALLEDKANIKMLGAEEAKQMIADCYTLAAINEYLSGDYKQSFEIAKLGFGINKNELNLELLILNTFKLGDYKEALKVLCKYHLHMNDLKILSLIEVITDELAPEQSHKITKSYFDEDDASLGSLLIKAKSNIQIKDFDKACDLVKKAIALNEGNAAYLLMAEYCLKTEASTTETMLWINKFYKGVEFINNAEVDLIMTNLLTRSKVF